MAFITVKDGTNIYYKDWGTGEPIVFVHGWCINCDSWEYMMEHLSQAGYRCIAFDHRGCGRSDQPYTGYNFKNLAQDLDDVIKALRLENATLVGHSLGCGVIASYLTSNDGHKAKKAVFISGTVPYMLKSDTNPDGTDRALVDQLLVAIKKDRPGYIRTLAAPFYNLPDSGVSPDLVEWTINITTQASMRAAVEMQLAAFEEDLREGLTKITIPVLLQHGDKDASCPAELTAIPAAKLICNSELRIYPDQPHGMYISEAEMLSKDIIEFIKK